jgi:HK97 family phage prohead protease
MERKNIPFEIKAIEEDGSFIAYGSTFGNEDLGGDVVVKGAFTKSIQSKNVDDILLLHQHDTSKIIGEFKSMEEDDRGLLLRGQLFINDIALAAETRFLMLKNKLKSMSIGFRIPEGGKSFENGRRMLKEIDLVEVSIVTFPMNPEAEILGVKKMKELTIREFEEKLRDAGFSRNEAKGISTDGFTGLVREAVEPKHEEEIKSDDWAEVVKQLEKRNYKL